MQEMRKALAKYWAFIQKRALGLLLLEELERQPTITQSSSSERRGPSFPRLTKLKEEGRGKAGGEGRRGRKEGKEGRKEERKRRKGEKRVEGVEGRSHTSPNLPQHRRQFPNPAFMSFTSFS
jgi:hypothetical protein